MPYTNFPNGITSFGIPVFGGSSLPPAGNVYFVKHTTDTDWAQFNDERYSEYDDGTVSIYNTIQAAVNASQDERGDIVYVCEGKWTEEVVIAHKDRLRIIGLSLGNTGDTNSPRIRVSDATTHYPFTTKIGTACSGAGFHVLSRGVEIAGFYIDTSGGYAGIYWGGGLNGGITGYSSENASGGYIHDNMIRGGGDGNVGIYMNGVRFACVVENNIFERFKYDAIQMDAGNASNESCVIKDNLFLAANAAYGIRTNGEANSCLHCNVHNNRFTDGASLAFTFAIQNQAGSTGVLAVTGNYLACANKLDLLASDVHAGNYKGTFNATEVFVTES